MSRPDRWWRPTNRRPAVRARSRMYRYNEYDVNQAYDRGIMRGTRDTVERRERGEQLNADFELVERAQRIDPERFRQLAEAIEIGGEAGKEAVERLAREWGVFPESEAREQRYAEGYADGIARRRDAEEAGWWSDVDDLAREAGVLDGDEDKALWDSVPPHGSGMVVEIEQWLRDRGRWLDFLRENGDLPDDENGQG